MEAETKAKEGSSETVPAAAPTKSCPASKVRRRVGDYSLLETDVQDQPFEFYQLLHRECPVYRMPETNFYIVSRYEDVRRIARDTEDVPESNSRPAGPRRRAGRHLSVGPAGTRLAERSNASALRRRAVMRAIANWWSAVFTPARVREIIPRLEQLAHQIIDRFIDRGECELSANSR